MLKVNDKIDLSNQASMDKLGKARKSGKWIVTNRKRTIVKFIGDENQAKDFFVKQRVKRGGAYILPELRKITITIEEQREMARKDLAMRAARGW